MSRQCRTRCEDLLGLTAANFPEIHTPSMRFIARLLRLRDVIFENAQREMARFELAPAEYSALSTLRKTAPPHELRPSDIYKGMLLSSGGLTKVINGLEARGLVERREDPEDGRGCRVRLTAAGVALAEAAMRAVIGSDTAMLNRVADDAELEKLAEALRPFTEQLDR